MCARAIRDVKRKLSCRSMKDNEKKRLEIEKRKERVDRRSTVAHPLDSNCSQLPDKLPKCICRDGMGLGICGKCIPENGDWDFPRKGLFSCPSYLQRIGVARRSAETARQSFRSFIVIDTTSLLMSARHVIVVLVVVHFVPFPFPAVTILTKPPNNNYIQRTAARLLKFLQKYLCHLLKSMSAQSATRGIRTMLTPCG